MELDFVARTDVGRVRDQNEDNFLVDRHLQLYVVCDGMGGHQGGEIASATAVNVVRETLAKHRSTLDSFRDNDGSGSEGEVLTLLTRAVERANSRIFERAQTNPNQKGMGTTLSLLLLMRSRAFIAHVGDSRIYRRRNGQTKQLTRDHSYIEEMKIRQPGAVPELVDERLKNAITRAVGGGPTIDVDTFCHSLRSDDFFLLCSDGLCGYFDAGDADAFLRGDSLETIGDDMIAFANDKGGEDNITALLVRVREVSSEEAHGISPFESLCQVEQLEHMKQDELKNILREGTFRRVSKDEKLGDSGGTDGVWLVVSGCIADSDPGTKSIKREAGSWVGLLPFINGSTGRGRATALVDSTVLFIPGPVFRHWATQSHDLALKLSYTMLRDLGSRLGGKVSRFQKQKSLGFSPWEKSKDKLGRTTGAMPAIPPQMAKVLDSSVLQTNPNLGRALRQATPTPPLPPPRKPKDE